MKLPQCHSRRDFPGNPTLFYCAHPQVHARDQLVRAEICKICEYWKQPPPAEFRPYPPPGGFIKRDGPCAHLGELLEYRPCATCRGNVQIKVFACRHPSHTQTTIHECENCADYERPVMTSAAPLVDESDRPKGDSLPSAYVQADRQSSHVT